jgi:hypothetical protein
MLNSKHDFMNLTLYFQTYRKYRKNIRSSLSTSSSRTRAERVMIILVESGIIYFLFFVSKQQHECLATSRLFVQLEGVVSNLGNVSEEEDSTPGLEFSGTVWEYMTSHIVVCISIL